jgi:hypothetical protein
MPRPRSCSDISTKKLPEPVQKIISGFNKFKKKRLAVRIANRIEKRQKINENKAKEYCSAVLNTIRKNGYIVKIIKFYMGKEFVRSQLDNMKSKNMKNELLYKENRERIDRYHEREREAQEVIQKTFITLMENDEQRTIRFAASLTMEDRDLLKLPRATLRRVIDLRKTALTATPVKEALGCSDRELQRWSEDGRLPILFRRRIPGGRLTLPVRFWASEDVDQARGLVASWREADQARRGRASRRSDQPAGPAPKAA